MIDPMFSWQCLSILFIVIPSVLMAMPVNMILVIYVRLCILSYNMFLTNQQCCIYLHIYIYLHVYMYISLYYFYDK